MKYLGIDFGTKRLGIAVSDAAGEFAFPKAIINVDEHVLERVVAMIKEEDYEKIIIGESIASNEMVNTLNQQAGKFGEKLSEKTGIPVVFQREDFSSFEAHRYQTDAGNRDDSAAAIILQRFLDKQKKKE